MCPPCLDTTAPSAVENIYFIICYTKESFKTGSFFILFSISVTLHFSKEVICNT